MGSERSYLTLKSSNNAFLKSAVSNLRQLEADIRLTHYQIDQSKLEFVKIIERASKNYDWLFPERSKKVLESSLLYFLSLKYESLDAMML